MTKLHTSPELGGKWKTNCFDNSVDDDFQQHSCWQLHWQWSGNGRISMRQNWQFCRQLCQQCYQNFNVADLTILFTIAPTVVSEITM